jgi:hypothetical protein
MAGGLQRGFPELAVAVKLLWRAAGAGEPDMRAFAAGTARASRSKSVWFSAAMATWFRDASGASSTRTPISEASAKPLAITASRGVETPRWFLKKNATSIDWPPRPDGER